MEEQALPATYSEAIRELESIVRKMQSDDCDIDNLSKYTARSLQLLKFCKERLQLTDSELKKLLAELS
ncbi:MAG: exodeoxyribonuclease VII small subunit [Muribaculaceae bacterium]|nr:exodeoxyribonuclease VII small subunit [Muribaculaceae bacterium]